MNGYPDSFTGSCSLLSPLFFTSPSNKSAPKTDLDHDSPPPPPTSKIRGLGIARAPSIPCFTSNRVQTTTHQIPPLLPSPIQAAPSTYPTPSTTCDGLRRVLRYARFQRPQPDPPRPPYHHRQLPSPTQTLGTTTARYPARNPSCHRLSRLEPRMKTIAGILQSLSPGTPNMKCSLEPQGAKSTYPTPATKTTTNVPTVTT